MQVGASPEITTTTIGKELARQRGWLLTVVVGFALYVLSVVIGLKPVGPLCGSPLLPKSGAAELSDAQLLSTGLAAQCYRNIDSASVPVWMLMGLGVAIVLVGVAIRIVAIRRSVAVQAA